MRTSDYTEERSDKCSRDKSDDDAQAGSTTSLVLFRQLRVHRVNVAAPARSQVGRRPGHSAGYFAAPRFWGLEARPHGIEHRRGASESEVHAEVDALVELRGGRLGCEWGLSDDSLDGSGDALVSRGDDGEAGELRVDVTESYGGVGVVELPSVVVGDVVSQCAQLVFGVSDFGVEAGVLGLCALLVSGGRFVFVLLAGLEFCSPPAAFSPAEVAVGEDPFGFGPAAGGATKGVGGGSEVAAVPPVQVRGGQRLALHLGAGRQLAAPQTPPRQLEVAPTPLPTQVVAHRG